MNVCVLFRVPIVLVINDHSSWIRGERGYSIHCDRPVFLYILVFSVLLDMVWILLFILISESEDTEIRAFLVATP